MKRASLAAALVIIILSLGVAYFAHQASVRLAPHTGLQQQNAPVPADISTFKTYFDQETGFSIKYPMQYSVQTGAVPAGAWGSRMLLTIYDGPLTGSKPQAVPVTVTIQKQPVGADGKVYHTVADYRQSGAAAHMAQGATNPLGDLVVVSGAQALHYSFPPSESTGVASDSYFFIKGDLIYEVGFNSSDPYERQMLQSVRFK